MRAFRAMGLCAAALLFSGLPPAAAQTEGGGGEPEAVLLSRVLEEAVRKAAPYVVAVETFGGTRRSTVGSGDGKRKPKPSPKKGLGPLKIPGFLQAQGTSTGLVVGREGWILTTRFVLNWNPSTIIVTLPDGRKFTAERKGEDRTRGIALLRIGARDLTPPPIVPRSEMRVGQWVAALGRSFGPRVPTAHCGILSALDRIQGKAIQCDAYTSPANYGGPLIDIEGRVLGLVVPLSPKGDMAGADWYDSGIGFAVPLDGLDPILEGMREGKVFRRGLVGLRMDPSFLGPGARILSVQRGTPAHHARLSKGDLLLEVDGEPSRNAMHVQDQIGRHVAGDLVELTFRKKDGTEAKVWVELEPRS